MLFAVWWSVWAEVFTNPFGMPANGVEFVVSEDHEGRALNNHSFDNVESLSDLRAAIDDVAYKDGLAGTMVVCATIFLVAEFFKKLF